MTPYNPFHGVNWGDPLDWPYVLSVLMAPFVFLLCMATIWGPGWFIGPLYGLFILWLEPEEVERHRINARSNQSPEARS
jgi:hypothetical protein